MRGKETQKWVCLRKLGKAYQVNTGFFSHFHRISYKTRPKFPSQGSALQHKVSNNAPRMCIAMWTYVSLYVYVHECVSVARDITKGLMHAKQVLYLWALHPPISFELGSLCCLGWLWNLGLKQTSYINFSHNKDKERKLTQVRVNLKFLWLYLWLWKNFYCEMKSSPAQLMP